MILKNVEKLVTAEKTRVVAEIEYGDGFSESWWFETHSDDNLDETNGCFWVSIMLPVAVTLGENLQIPFKIDNNFLSKFRRYRKFGKCGTRS
ncbi:hypothetical protein [Alteromonas genovensis]|uniref:hypothetical protein n=1 Tax=Alteromonas genovensis TaxID=471225 RepID=UPI002FE3C27D